MGSSLANEIIKRASAVVPETTLDVAPGDIARNARPAPGVGPEGAFAYLAASDGTEAWIVKGDDGAVVGYLRDASQPNRAIEITDPAVWAKVVDGLGLTEQAVPLAAPAAEPVVDELGQPVPDPAADPAAADATAAPDPTAAAAAPTGAPAPAVAGVKDGEPEDAEGKAAAGSVITPEDHEEQTGIMVALMVPEGDAADIMLTDFPTALPATELHLTLAYLGKTEEVDDEGAFYANVLEALRDVAAEHDTLNGVVSGVGRFNADGDADAFVYLFDAPELPDLRHDLVAALEDAGVDVNHDHGFTPHITLAYLKEGEDSPIRRAESKVLAFDCLTFCYGDQRLNIRLGGTNPDEEDAEFSVEAGRPGYVDTTAPSAMPDGKAMPPQFRRSKGGKNKIGKGKGGPPIAAGAFVSWGNQRGKVDLVVTNGVVPGVEEDITGTADKPAARVVVYEQGAGGKWKATGKKVGVSASSLKRSAPFTFGKKDLDLTDPEAVVVEILTGYYETVDTKTQPHPLVDPAAVWAVYERGVDSWPGEDTGVPTEAWALGRTKAFLTVAAGDDVPGYEADRDLLPEGHPLAVKAAPVLTVRTNDTGAPERILTPDETRELAERQESKVALTIMEGEQFVGADEVRKMIESLRGLGLGHA